VAVEAAVVSRVNVAVEAAVVSRVNVAGAGAGTRVNVAGTTVGAATVQKEMKVEAKEARVFGLA